MNIPQELPFSRHGDRYDQSTFQGRAFKFFNIVDPRTLLPSLFFGQSLEQAQNNLNHYETRKVPDHVLWQSRKIVEAQVHPDTGDIIPPPFRMSGFVPFGTPVIVGMLVAGSSPMSNIFWQWLNQSHNAAINYCNRNASVKVTDAELFQSYAVAVSAAIGVKLTADKVVQTINKPMLGRFAPFFAVASANVLNVCMMRKAELNSGIDVLDENKTVLGQSPAAAKKAITETAITRVLLPIPILVMSPLMLIGVERQFPKLMKHRRINIAVQASIVVVNFLFGLPLSMSCFKQKGELPVSELEPSIAKQLPSTVPYVYYNKGL